MISIFKNNVIPALLSIGLHGALLAFLFFGFAPSPTPPQVKTPNFVQAKLVKLEDQTKSQKPVDKPQVVDLTQKRKEQERLEQQRRQQEQKRKQEQAQKAEAERKKKEQEKKVQEEAARKAKAEAERKAKAEAERKQQEQLRKQREQQAFEAALAQEQASLEEQSYAVTAQSYMSAIAQRVSSKWSRPASARNGMQCVLLIRLVPTGRVVSVDVLKGSGNSAFDLSAVQAVKSVEQFDEVKDMPREVFERHYREFEFLFNPQDLRQ
jgi:colicin import membrane protein